MKNPRPYPYPLLAISKYTVVNSLGRGIAASIDALKHCRSGLVPTDQSEFELETWVGRVTGLENEPVEGTLAKFDCRNNRLALMGFRSDAFEASVLNAKERYGAGRIGVFLGTSTSGIRQTEGAYARRENDAAPLPADFNYFCTHNTFSVADYCQQYFGLTGPATAVSTACSSSAKVFAVAYRHIMSGLCDAAIVGGVDTLCGTTLYGFNSLELVSSDPCKPWDKNRNGINIGEAAGFALLERPESSSDSLMLLGYGESSDAYHMSTPHPEGQGAELAMRRALSVAGLQPPQVDYINLHGTSTISNDRSEDCAVVKVFGEETPCSSTKGWTGHALGAAGITELVFSCLAIENNLMPKCLNTVDKDPQLKANVLLENNNSEVRIAASNSFGFGGSNCCLIVGNAP